MVIVVFMHNSFICMNEYAPYQTVLGRQPAMLPPLEGAYLEERTPVSQRGSVVHPEGTDSYAVAQRDMARMRKADSLQILFRL